MNRKLFLYTAALLLFLSALSGCLPGLPLTANQGDQQATQDAFIEQAVRGTATQMAQLAQIAQLQTQVAGAQVTAPPQVVTVPPQVVTATPGPATDTPVAPSPIPPTATAVPPTATPVPPTVTPVPTTATSIPATPTATAIPCDAAEFVTDVTIPDGTVISPDARFTKTWRLKNTGACAWTTSFDVVLVGGDSMKAPAAVDLPGNVAPGQVIDISVNLTAPSSTGHYRGNWRLRDAAGVLFGVGKTSVPFYVDIKVNVPQSEYPLDFIASMCQAVWSTGEGLLPCPGAENDAAGFMMRVDKPTLETGYVDDEPVLVTYPQMITDGYIRGKYPAIRVETGYHFMTIIGCGYNLPSCDVKFQLEYQIGSGSIQTLKTWQEVTEKQVNNIDVDLSSLAGKDVKFILTVRANGSSDQDRAQWLLPRIVKK